MSKVGVSTLLILCLLSQFGIAAELSRDLDLLNKVTKGTVWSRQALADGTIRVTLEKGNVPENLRKKSFSPDGLPPAAKKEYFEIKTPDGKTVKHGLYASFWWDGSVYSTGVYVNGKKNGVWITNNPITGAKTIETFKNGELDGPYLIFYKTGRLCRQGRYVEGKSVDEEWENYSPSGIPMKIHRPSFPLPASSKADTEKSKANQEESKGIPPEEMEEETVASEKTSLRKKTNLGEGENNAGEPEEEPRAEK